MQDKWWFNLRLFMICLFGWGLYFLAEQGYGLRINQSQSLPYKIFFSTPSTKLEQGGIFSINHPHISQVIAKTLIGFPGDNISIRQGIVFVNDIYIGSLKLLSNSGKIYHPIKEGIIPANHYFVCTPHPEGFDSRYSEFGLIKKDWFKERLCPLF